VIQKEIKNTKEEKKKHEIEDMMEKLKQEKEALAKAKQPRQLSIEKMPKKIEIEKKEDSPILSLFSSKKEKGEEVHEGAKNIPVIAQSFNNWALPSLDLLDNRTKNVKKDENEIRRKEIEIQEKLLQFKIEVDMEGYQVGPTVIQYRLKPKS
jgi:DNA segregation ATPase FtsK/SpoIIIE-like protein